MTGADDFEPPGLADLRRALYRPDATEADRDRYVALLQASALRDAGAGISISSPRVPAAPARRRPLIAGALVLGVILILCDIALPRRDGGDARPSERVAFPVRSTTVEVAVGDGEVLGQRFSGRGAAAVPLVTGGAPLDGGRLVVVLSSSDSATVAWRAEGGAGRAAAGVVAEGESAPLRGSPGRSVTTYRAAPPARILVRAPVDTRWTLDAVLTR